VNENGRTDVRMKKKGACNAPPTQKMVIAMIQTIIGYPGRFLLAMVLVLLPASALAQSPWQWQMSLRIDKAGDALYMPGAVAFDLESERYYAVDAGRSRLVSFSRKGEMHRAFTADDRLKAPFDMVRLADGKLWVVEKGRNSITLIDVGAKEVKPFILKDGNRQIFPDRIAHAGGKLHVLDRASGQVVRLASDMSVEQRFTCQDCMGGFLDFVVANGSVWALETLGKKVYRFNPDGTIAKTIDLGTEVDFPVSLDVEASGIIYVLDRHRNNVVAYGEDGSFRYRFLGPGHAQGQLHFPRQLRFDPWGHLCVVDEGNGRVEIFSR
jgi:DNA-binding beta-propeller fold protein YncE